MKDDIWACGWVIANTISPPADVGSVVDVTTSEDGTPWKLSKPPAAPVSLEVLENEDLLNMSVGIRDDAGLGPVNVLADDNRPSVSVCCWLEGLLPRMPCVCGQKGKASRFKARRQLSVMHSQHVKQWATPDAPRQLQDLL
jgi:hypothetical protein